MGPQFLNRDQHLANGLGCSFGVNKFGKVHQIECTWKSIQFFQEQLDRFKKMENFCGVERHDLTHRVVFLNESNVEGSPKTKKMKLSQ